MQFPGDGGPRPQASRNARDAVDSMVLVAPRRTKMLTRVMSSLTSGLGAPMTSSSVVVLKSYSYQSSVRYNNIK